MTRVWQFDCYLIIPHPTEPRVLLMPGAEGWSLPHMHIEVTRWHDDLRMLSQAVAGRLGVHVTVLRRIYVRTDDDSRQAETIYVLENHSPAWEPPDGAWVGREGISELTAMAPPLRSAVEEWLAEAEGAAVPELRNPWARPGWFARAQSWMEARLARLGYTLIAPIEQFRSASISCVLRARTTAGNVYFKAAAALPLFCNEPVLTSALADRYPGAVPSILAIDPESRWMLMAEFGPPLSESRDAGIWAEPLRRFGQIQAASAASAADLLAIGCLDRRLNRLIAQVEALLADDAALADLKPDEIDRLRALRPSIVRACDRLAGYAVPLTLVHGDLHANNIALDGGKPVFFDWTDACVAHPFLDLITMLDPGHDLQGQLEVPPAVLRDAYLSAWTDYEPIERLQEACTLAFPLGALHQAVSYQHIIAGLEPAAWPEWEGSIGDWLRKALELMSSEGFNR